MKKHKKSILIGVAVSLILVVTLLFIANENKVVLTKEKKDFYNNTSSCEQADLQNTYKPKLIHIEGSKYQIVIEDPNNEKVVFQVINDSWSGVKSIDQAHIHNMFTKDKPLEFTAEPLKDDLDGYTISIEIKLIGKYDSKGQIVKSTCDGFTAKITFENQGSAITEPQKNLVNSNRGTGKICTNFIQGIYNESQFNAIGKEKFNKYNYAVVDSSGKRFYEELLDYCFDDYVILNYKENDLKDMITNAIDIWKDSSIDTASTMPEFFATKELAGNSTDTTEHNLKCKYNPTKEELTLDYYNNKKYYYKTKTVESTVTYNYNYVREKSGDDIKYEKTDTQTICNRTCEEAVKVEYGPPIASKAGLCFEYKVKVTSYVKCDAEVNAKPPKKPTYCTPSAYCNNGVAGYEGQAGPNEKFESCIKDCDDGKYTESCSQKCYKEVYGKNNRITNTSNIKKYQVSKMANDDATYCNNTDGCYYWDKNRIMWEKKTSLFGRWYIESKYCSKRSDCGPNGELATSMYFADSNGIRRADYGSVNCQDVCSWTGCSKSQYLNSEDAAEDYKLNLANYKDAVKSCKGSASCGTRTAEFSISIKYDTLDKNNNKQVTTINYPLTSNSEKLNESGSGHALQNPSIILDYEGCYNNKEHENKYMTEWSFPGTYIHTKKNQISYKPKDTSSWHLEKNKFCLVPNAESVNSAWYNAWYNGKGTLAEPKAQAGTSNGYNIEAIAKNFGHFGWNFNITCFYALPGGDECEDCGKMTDYTIRTVDIDNLFPNSNNPGSASEYEREIGFNWTDAAEIKGDKNSSYKVLPSQLIEQIKATSTTIYDDSNLEYKFHLTPETLRVLKKYNEVNPYGDFKGESDIKGGVMVYRSNLFRNDVSEEGTDNSFAKITDALINDNAKLGVNNTKLGG